MKRIILIFGSLMLGVFCRAQLARWVIPPDYDTITVKVVDKLLESQAGGNTILWTLDGKNIFSTKHYIRQYNEGVATIIDREFNTIAGIVDETGRSVKTPVSGIAFDNPDFHDGFLITQSTRGFGYLTPDGMDSKFEPSKISYPFHNGYASYMAYDQPEKLKDPYYSYRLANDSLPFSLMLLRNDEVKNFERKDIKFLSSVADNGLGVAVIKDKLYWFNSESGMFEPIQHGAGDSEKKRHLNLDGNFEQAFLMIHPEEFTIRAKYGKSGRAYLHFDSELMPTAFEFNDGDVMAVEGDSVAATDGDDLMVFERRTIQVEEVEANMDAYRQDGLFGLTLNDKRVLPAQFEAVGLMYENHAAVKVNGKWGVVELLPDVPIKPVVNNGDIIAFKHYKYTTKMRLDLPPYVTAKELRLDIKGDIDCSIEPTSRSTKDTESGNFVEYDCALIIPQTLPDTFTEVTYEPISVSYDGITLFDVPLKVVAWHRKTYTVEINDSKTTIENGVATFTINIDPHDFDDAYFDVTIQADSLAIESERHSQYQYKFMVSNLQEGSNYLNILVTEDRCPSSIFPFEITYVKPVPKKKTQEAVVVRQKAREPRKEEQSDLPFKI